MSATRAVALPDLRAMHAADTWTEQREQFIRQHFCGNAPENVADLFIDAARRRHLSPEAKQICLINRKGNFVVQTTIDGFRLIADRTGTYAGSDEPRFVDAPDLLANSRQHPAKAVVTVWKFVNGERCAYTASARWDEFNGGANNWLTMPYHMLAKVAESHALRKAFPEDLSGLYTEDEMGQADVVEVRIVNRETGEMIERQAIVTEAPKPEAAAQMREKANTRLHAAAAEKFPEEADKHLAAHDLVAARFGYLSTSEASGGELHHVRETIEGWTPEQSTKALTWCRVITDASTETMLTDAGIAAKEDGVNDDFVREVYKERLHAIRVMAGVDDAVKRATQP